MARTHDPIAVYQDVLDRGSEALWDGAWDALVETMAHPNEMGAYDNVVRAEVPEDTLRFARDYRSMLREAGATAYLRVARTAALSKDGRHIDGVHEVHVMRGGARIASFTSEAALVLGPDGAWRAEAIISQARVTDNPINVGNPPPVGRGPDD